LTTGTMDTDTRALKRTRYLEAARRILERDGLDALTMQALANEVGAAVGTIYGYFPSKGSLVAELQMAAVSTIVDAWIDASKVWGGAMRARGLTEHEVALAEVIAFGEFFLAIQVDFALEFDLNRGHLDEGRELFESVDLTAMRPSARGMVDGPATSIRASIDAGMLRTDPAEVHERVLMLLLALYGISLLSVPRPDTAHSLVPRLTRLMVRDLALAWGADQRVIDRVTPVVIGVVGDYPLSGLREVAGEPAPNGLAASGV
jgi:AcrR family transcriptional regulator